MKSEMQILHFYLVGQHTCFAIYSSLKKKAMHGPLFKLWGRGEKHVNGGRYTIWVVVFSFH